MDKNQIVGLVVISAIFIVYLTFFSPETLNPENVEDITQQTTEQLDNSSFTQSNDEENNETYQSENQVEDSISAIINASKFGIFSKAITGSTEKIFEHKTSTLNLKFSSKGGELVSTELIKFKTFRKQPLYLLDKNSFSESIKFVTKNQSFIALDQLDFDIVSSNDSVIRFESVLSSTSKVIRDYKIDGKNYVISQNIKFKGLNDEVMPKTIQFQVEDNLKILEKGIRQSRQNALINFYNEDGYDYERFASESNSSEEISGVQWFSFKQSYFTKGFIFNTPVAKMTIGGSMSEKDTSKLKHFEASFLIPGNAIMGPEGFTISNYYGPNDYYIMQEIAPDFDQNIELGWMIFRQVNKYMFIPLFTFLEAFIPNYGLIILIMVFILKGVLFPLTYKSYLGMAKMRVLKPEVDTLTEKYKDDKQKSQAESMKL